MSNIFFIWISTYEEGGAAGPMRLNSELATGLRKLPAAALPTHMQLPKILLAFLAC